MLNPLALTVATWLQLICTHLATVGSHRVKTANNTTLFFKHFWGEGAGPRLQNIEGHMGI